MKRGGQLLIVVGLVLGLITAGLVFMATRAPAPKIETRPVVVAVQDIPDRLTIQASMLGIKEWPLEAVPPDALSKIDDAVGKVSMTKIYNGEPILRAKMQEAKEASSLAFAVPPGMVAFSIPASEGSTVAGAVQPGDFVDVLVSLEIVEADAKGNESKAQPTVQLTLQDVKVLRVGAWVPAPTKAGETTTAQAGKSTETKTITVLVSQQDALVLKYAKEQGSIDLVLRAFNDHEPVTTDSVYTRYMVERFKFARPTIIVRPGASGGQ